MAKLSGPLLSFGATGSVADSITFTDRNNQHIGKQHAIPSNPNTAAQATQRGYVADASNLISAARTSPTHSISPADISALDLLIKRERSKMSWYNRLCGNCISVSISGGIPGVMRDGLAYWGGVSWVLSIYCSQVDGINILSAVFSYGSKPATLLLQSPAVVDPITNHLYVLLPPVTPSIPIYWQLSIPIGNPSSGVCSGIYNFVP